MGWFNILKKHTFSWFSVLKAVRIESPPPRLSNGEIDYAKYFKHITPRLELATMMLTELMKQDPTNKSFYQESLSLNTKYQNMLNDLIEPQENLTQQVGRTEDPKFEFSNLGKVPKLTNGKINLRVYMKKIFPRLNLAASLHNELMKHDNKPDYHKEAQSIIKQYALKLKGKATDNERGADTSDVGSRKHKEEA